MKHHHRAMLVPWAGGGATIAPPGNTVLPVISGTLAIGQTLTTTDGTWSGSPSFTYQWKRDGVNIGGATANTYVLTTSDPGTTITVTVTGTNGGGATPATSAGVAPSSILANLTVYLKLYEASGARVDSTGRGNDFTTITNAPGNTTGKVSSAIQLTAASTQSVSRASTADLVGTADWSIAAWVYLDSVGAERTIMSKSTEWVLRYNTSSARFDFGWTDGGSVFRNVLANTFGALSLSTWYFVVAGHNSVLNQIRISVNNGAFNTAAATGVTTGAAVAAVGVRGAGTNLWDGRQCEIAIAQKLWSAAEITALYNGGNGTTYPF